MYPPPWELDSDKVDEAIRMAEDWLADVLGTRIGWNWVRTINSQRTLAEWRTEQVGLIQQEVELLGMPWSDEYIYLAFVRGMGGIRRRHPVQRRQSRFCYGGRRLPRSSMQLPHTHGRLGVTGRQWVGPQLLQHDRPDWGLHPRGPARPRPAPSGWMAGGEPARLGRDLNGPLVEHAQLHQHQGPDS